MPKRSIREDMLARRKHSSAETCLGLSLDIQERFLQSQLFAGARCVALYSAMHNEVLTEEVARRTLASGKRLVYPRVDGASLTFVTVEALEELRPGSFGVLEPPGQVNCPYTEIDLLVVPGVAFDLQGHRLGYGKGFYDRALSGCPEQTVRVGFAYEFQLLDELPVEEHDRSLSVIITEQRTLWLSSG